MAKLREGVRQNGEECGLAEKVRSRPQRLRREPAGEYRKISSGVSNIEKLFKMVQFLGRGRAHPVRMKIKLLTQKQLCSVACPTCGVPAGKRCLLHSGGLRSGPHVDRKLAAAEAVEKKERPGLLLEVASLA